MKKLDHYWVILLTHFVGGGGKQMENGGTSPIQDSVDPMELLLETLVQILVDLPVTNVTYILHLEAVNTLIVILSQQMFVSNKPALKLPSYRLVSVVDTNFRFLSNNSHSLPFRFLMQGSVSALSASFTKKLLSHYIEQLSPPYPCWNNDSSGSIVIGVASKASNYFEKLREY